MSDTLKARKDELAADLRKAVEDAQALLRSSVDVAGDEVAGARDRIKTLLNQSRQDLDHLEQAAVARAKAAGDAADGFVHQRPWQSIGVAAGIGLLLGLLIGRR